MRKVDLGVSLLLTTVFSISNTIGASALITGADIQPGSIASLHILDNSISTVDILNETITGADIRDGSITTYDIMDGTLSTYDLKDNSLQSIDIKDGSVLSVDIQDNTVTSIDVKNGSLEFADLGVSITGMLNGFTGNISTLQSSVLLHSQDITTLKNDVTLVKSRLDTAETDIVALQAKAKNVWVYDNNNTRLGILLGEHLELEDVIVQYFDVNTQEVMNEPKNGPGALQYPLHYIYE